MRRVTAWIVLLGALFKAQGAPEPLLADRTLDAPTVLAAENAGSLLAPGRALGRLPLLFAEGRGQHRPEVRYRTVLSTQVATVTDEGLVLTLLGPRESGSVGPRVGHNVRLGFA